MLYKIVPFLVWLHLQERGQGRLIAPNMKKVLAEPAINRQAWAHVLALGLPALQALAIFAAIGVGMALPYLAASLIPAVAKLLPRMNKGGTVEPVPGIKLTAVRAEHSSVYVWRNPATAKGRAAHLFKDMVGDFPNAFSYERTHNVPITRAVLNQIKARNIAYRNRPQAVPA